MFRTNTALGLRLYCTVVCIYARDMSYGNSIVFSLARFRCRSAGAFDHGFGFGICAELSVHGVLKSLDLLVCLVPCLVNARSPSDLDSIKGDRRASLPFAV